MQKRLKLAEKVVCLILSFVCAALVCGSFVKEDIHITNATTDKHVDIGGYFMPNMSKAQIKTIKDCGLDYIVIDDWTSIQRRDASGNNSYGENPAVDGIYRASLNSGYLSTVLRYCSDVGLGALIMNPYGEYQKTNNSSAASAEDSKTMFGASSYITVDYTQFDSFWGFTVSDEPYHDSLWKKAGGDKKDGWLYTQSGEFNNSIYKNYWFDVSLFPYGANLAFSEIYTDWNTYSTNLFSNVLSNLTYGKKVAMFDFYPFTTTGLINTYLTGFDIMAAKAKFYGCDFATYIQSVAWTADSRACNKAELEFQIFTNLVFGAKGYRYFTVLTPEQAYNQSGNENSALISRRGYPTNTYYNVKELNAKVKSFDSWLLNYTWQGVKAVNGTVSSLNTASYISNSACNPSKITSAEAQHDILIGCYTDDTRLLTYGGQSVDSAFVIMNYTDPLQGKKNNISINFGSATRALVFEDGEAAKEVQLNDHVFSTRLDEGEGLFVIPV